MITRRAALRMSGLGVPGLIGLGVPGLAALLAGCDDSKGKPDKLVFATFSGPYEKAVQTLIVPRFEQKTGIKALLDVGTPPTSLAKIQANPKTPPLAVLLGLQDTTFQAIDSGVVDKLDMSRIPNAREIPARWTAPFDGYSVPTGLGSWGLAFNKTRVPKPPKSWKEFVERTIAGDFGKTVAMPTVPTYPVISLWMTAFSYGKKFDQEGIDFAFAKFKAMRPNISRTWSQLSEPGNLLISGDASITPLNDGRTYGLIDDGAKELDFTRLEEGAIASGTDLMKVKNASDYAYDFINLFLDAEVQSGLARVFPGYLWSNPNTKYTPEAHARLPDEKQLLFPPAREISKLRTALVERWNKEMAS